MLPRVVGLLPTYNRPEMAHRAVHLFLEQDYEGPKHLLVFDDGERRFEPCPSCSSELELVRHEKISLPEKRNRMMRHLDDRAAMYFMWDDDDYHGPARVRRQVEALYDAPAVLLRPTLYYNQISRELRMSRWTSDGTIAYRFSFWLQRPYTEGIDPGSGAAFLAGRLTEIAVIKGELDYVVVVHKGQRHTPPAFGLPDFTETTVRADLVDELLKFR